MEPPISITSLKPSLEPILVSKKLLKPSVDDAPK